VKPGRGAAPRGRMASRWMDWTADWYLRPPPRGPFEPQRQLSADRLVGGRVVGAGASARTGEDRVQAPGEVGAARFGCGRPSRAHTCGSASAEIRFTPRFRTPLERELVA